MVVIDDVDLDKQTGVVDVQLLDVLATIESLMRNAREIQRQLLRVRGVPRRQTPLQRRAAAASVRKLAGMMMADSDDLSKVLGELETQSDVLKQAAGAR